MSSTLFTGGPIHTQTDDTAEWVLVDDRVVRGIGRASDQAPADAIVDLHGATLVPAFCDAHVHLPATGLYAQGMDFRSERSARRILEAFGRAGADPSAILFGGNFEDPLDEELTRWDLDEVVGARPALLARADMHSCIVSSALLEELDLGPGEGGDRDETGAPTG